MILKDFFKFAVNSISKRKLRSWLTILGIIIGIAAIVGLMSIGQGLQNAVTAQFETMGTDKIMVTPKTFMGPGTGSGGYTDKEVDALKRISELKYVIPIVTGNVEVEFHNQKRYTSLFGYEAEGISEDVWKDMGFEVSAGRFPEENEAGVVGIGSSVSEDMFDDKVVPKSRIFLNGEKYKVVGIAEPIGNSQDDAMLYLPLDEAQKLLKKESYDFIMAIAKPGTNVDSVAAKVERVMEHVRDNEDFAVTTMEQLVQTVGNILGIIQLVLVGIAAISLLVGAVGIMNTMYTSVLERTRDIGIMKAIGATNNHILALFLVESGIIGAVGGAIGAFFGVGMALGFGSISGYMNLPITFMIRIDWKLIIIGILLAFFLGAISGMLPARSASKLKPADALRYE